MNKKYFIPATQTDPACPTPEGEKLLERQAYLTELKQRCLVLADDLESEHFQTLGDNILHAAQTFEREIASIEVQLQEG